MSFIGIFLLKSCRGQSLICSMLFKAHLMRLMSTMENHHKTPPFTWDLRKSPCFIISFFSKSMMMPLHSIFFSLFLVGTRIYQSEQPVTRTTHNSPKPKSESVEIRLEFWTHGFVQVVNFWPEPLRTHPMLYPSFYF